MFCVKIRNTSTVHHSHTSMLFIGCIAHCILSLKKTNLMIVIKRKEHALRCPYRSRARARVMGEVEEVQEQMKANTEALKEQITTMMEAMMSIKEIMEVSAAAITATSTTVEVDLTPPSSLNQMNHPTSDMVGKDLGSTGGPHYVQIQNKHAFPPYG